MIRAAKYLGVAPWELVERKDGIHWQSWAAMAEAAENEAREMLENQANQTRARKR